MIVLLDNFDSFTYNLYQYIAGIGERVVVLKNTATLDEIEAQNPKAIVLSPGPGCPDTAGICLDVVRHFHKHVPILGICLGHQVIGQFFGASIVKANQPMHGKLSKIEHDGRTIFSGIQESFDVVRYHSLVINPHTIPACLAVSATTEDGTIMAVRHTTYPVEGVQFHPESILSEHGMTLLRNFFART